MIDGVNDDVIETLLITFFSENLYKIEIYSKIRMKYTLKDLYNDVKVNGRDCTDDHAITLPRNALKLDPLVRLMTFFYTRR